MRNGSSDGKKKTPDSNLVEVRMVGSLDRNGDSCPGVSLFGVPHLESLSLVKYHIIK